MSNKTPNYSAILDREASRITNRLVEIRSLLEHKPSLGSAVEQTVSRLIRKFVPDSCEITSGFAVDAEGNLSPQQDILVIRKHKIGALGTYAGFGIYPIEHVLASIEVKTKLTIAEFTSAMDSLEQLALLAPDIPGESTVSSQPGNLLTANIPVCGPFTAVFALETDIAIGRILYESQNHACNSKTKTRLNNVHVLDQSATCWVDRTGAKHPAMVLDPQALNVAGVNFNWEKRPLEIATSTTNANESLKVFLGLLLGFLSWYRPPPLDLQKYLLTGLSLKFDIESKQPKPKAEPPASTT